MFQLFVQRLYGLAQAVNLGNVLYREIKVVDQQHYGFSSVLMEYLNHTHLVCQFSPGELHLPVNMGYKPVRIDESD